MDCPHLIRLSRPAMGSLFEIYAGGTDAEALESAANRALDRVEQLESRLSHYLPDSDICLINARAYEEPVPVAPYLMDLLRRLRRWGLETEGAFDVTAGKLVRAWGLFRRGQAHGEAPSRPDCETLAALVAQIGWRHVELNEATGTIRFLSPQVELHLGAAGKGYIVQCAADLLRESGVECALLHCGQSSIIAVGAPPGQEGWSVGLADPAGGAEPLTTLSLKDAALSVSGSAEQSVTIDGTRYSHLFDPRTGEPIDAGTTVSVLSADAADGDALSTAFAVQGKSWTRDFCRSHPDIDAIFLTTD
jgi:thiamine biosynthesis lipoprotein